ncbi:Ppx/GppA phosphatase family protein [Magnetococcus sp. PR-3]|uniref:Ppx/GppA phosphatase family protein n=1 Tax=Magnetococcus sp. PR-3 TaxID=3120355 RepID=UPI002FCDF7B8
MKFAAIDIGSNAVRLFIAHVYETGQSIPIVRKDDLYRVPLRLGADAFIRGEITPQTEDQFVTIMQAFRKLIDFFQPTDCIACATSALRTARNGREVVMRVSREANINIEIIEGQREAELIALNRSDGRFDQDDFLFIDVGGGSTELTLLSQGRQLDARSFPIGTVRLKENLVDSVIWDEMKRWIKAQTVSFPNLTAIGSGGNINKLVRMGGDKRAKKMKRDEISKVLKMLKGMTYEQRMRELGLRPDRADVIVPAGEIFVSAMKWAKVKSIVVPQFGLSDGMVHYLYRRHTEAQGGRIID